MPVSCSRPQEMKPMEPAVAYNICPIHATINVLGKKWTILILRDIALRKINRFNQIKRSLPGITSRVLILRLQELEEAGYIRPDLIKDKPRVVEWQLTEKGLDTIPVLLSILEFGAKWCADEVFEDHKPRTMKELYPSLYENKESV
jgi:DNA-binding HxlR family transcriptional regulator